MDETLKALNILVGRLRADGSARYKKKVLYKYGQGLSSLLATIYDTDKPLYITSKVLIGRRCTVKYEEYCLHEILYYLRTRTWTGNQAVENVTAYIYQNPGYEKLVYNIIDGDLKCGIGVKTINSVWPGLIFDFKSSVPLANKYKEGLADFEDEKWYYSRKLDGVRCLCFIRKNSIEFFSRNGKKFTTLSVLEKDIRENMNPDTVDIIIDGELCIIDEDGNEDFTSIMKEIRRKDHTIENPMFYSFGYYSIKEFQSGIQDVTEYSFRQWMLHCHNLSPIDMTDIRNKEHFTEIVSHIPKSWEGIMIKKYPTQFKRSNNLLKVKFFNEKEYTVVGMKEGTKVIEGEEEDCLASVTIRHNDNSVSVGSGFSDNERLLFLEYPEMILGKTITVKYFEETKDSLRFPIYKGFRDYE